MLEKTLSRLQETAEPIKLKPWQMKIYREIKSLTLRLRVLPETNADNLVVITDQVTCVPFTLLTLMKQETITCNAKAESTSVVKITYTKLSRFGQ